MATFSSACLFLLLLVLFALVADSSGSGEIALSLSGLILLERGRTGDPGDAPDPVRSNFFHFVDEVEVTIGDGLSCRSLGEGFGIGAL